MSPALVHWSFDLLTGVRVLYKTRMNMASFTLRTLQDLSAFIRDVAASRSKPVSDLIREALRYGLPVEAIGFAQAGSTPALKPS